MGETFFGENYSNSWKCIEIEMLKNFNENYLVLWKTEAPQCVLRRIGNCQIAASLSIWYEYRSALLKDMNLYQYFTGLFMVE